MLHVYVYVHVHDVCVRCGVWYVRGLLRGVGAGAADAVEAREGPPRRRLAHGRQPHDGVGGLVVCMHACVGGIQGSLIGFVLFQQTQCLYVGTRTWREQSSQMEGFFLSSGLGVGGKRNK